MPASMVSVGNSCRITNFSASNPFNGAFEEVVGFAQITIVALSSAPGINIFIDWSDDGTNTIWADGMSGLQSFIPGQGSFIVKGKYVKVSTATAESGDQELAIQTIYHQNAPLLDAHQLGAFNGQEMTIPVRALLYTGISTPAPAEPVAAVLRSHPNHRTLTGSISALNGIVALQSEGLSVFSARISGTWTGTLVFEVLLGGAWHSVNVAYNHLNYAFGSTTTINGAFIIDCATATQVRVRASAWTSGTANVELSVSSSASQVVLIPFALPSGDNNIGNVDVVTLPALPTGDNNIGNVDVLTLPSLPAGIANIGRVNIDSIAAGDNNIGNVDIASIAAGDNTIGRVKIDQSLNATPKRYQITLVLTGATVNTNLAGLRKQSANAVCRIKRFHVFMAHAAAGIGNPISFWRATTVAGGSQVTAADIPKKDTNAGNATLEVRTGAVTGTKANQRLWAAGTVEVVTTNQGGPHFIWESKDMSDDIVLRGDEGIIIDQSPIAGDADDRYLVTIDWEEE